MKIIYSEESYDLLYREIITHNDVKYYRYKNVNIGNAEVVLDRWEYSSQLDSVNGRQEIDMYELEEIYQNMLRRLKLERILNENNKIR